MPNARSSKAKSAQDRPVDLDCGGHLHTQYGGRYRRCILGHVHCTQCGKTAKPFNKNWTCGVCQSGK